MANDFLMKVKAGNLSIQGSRRDALSFLGAIPCGRRAEGRQKVRVTGC